MSATTRGFQLSTSLADRLSTIADLAAITVEAVKEVATMTDAQIDRTAELDRALARLAEASRTRNAASSPMLTSSRALEDITRR